MAFLGAGMDISSSRSVVIHNFNVVNTVGSPDKTNPPLVVDADAMFTFSVANQRFQTIPRWNPQSIQRRSRIQLLQFSLGNRVDIDKSFDPNSRKQIGSGFICERKDHAWILYRLSVSGNRKAEPESRVLVRQISLLKRSPPHRPFHGFPPSGFRRCKCLPCANLATKPL